MPFINQQHTITTDNTEYLSALIKCTVVRQSDQDTLTVTNLGLSLLSFLYCDAKLDILLQQYLNGLFNDLQLQLQLQLRQNNQNQHKPVLKFSP